MYNSSKNIKTIITNNRNIMTGNWCTYNTAADTNYFTGSVSRFGDDKKTQRFRI